MTKPTVIPEQIVLLGEDGSEVGVAEKLASHHAHTPLHRAFSCYIFDQDGKLLVTQRALSKKVWPGVWTNSVCGHPAPGETFEDAVIRRAGYELGMKVKDVHIVLPEYRYMTPPFNGIVENELCPVFIARTASDVVPNAEEVEAYRWMPWDAYITALADDPESYSYWTKDQMKRLTGNSIIVSYRSA